MCLQVLFLGPALPSTFGLISEKLVVSPVLRTLTLKVKVGPRGVCYVCVYFVYSLLCYVPYEVQR